MTTGTPYQDLSPHEQVFQLQYWGFPDEPMPPEAGNASSTQGVMRDTVEAFWRKRDVSKKTLHGLAKITLDVIEGRQEVTWQRGGFTLPPEEGSIAGRSGTLLLYDIEEMLSISPDAVLPDTFLMERAKNADDDAVLEYDDPEKPQLDDLVTMSTLQFIRNSGSIGGTPGYTFECVRTQASKQIVNTDSFKIYDRTMRFAYVTRDRDGLSVYNLCGGIIKKPNGEVKGIDYGLGNLDKMNTALTLNRTLRMRHSLMRLRAVGICHTPEAVPAKSQRAVAPNLGY